MKAKLRFAVDLVDKDQDFWSNVLGTDESKIKCLVFPNYITQVK